MILVSKKDYSLLLIFLYIPVSIYRSFLSVLTALVCTCGSNVLEESIFMNFRQGVINVRRKGETREETKTTERKKEKNCKLGVFGRISDFKIIISGLEFNSLVRSFETRSFAR